MFFKVDWVLKNELAIGSIPRKYEHLLELKNNKIKWILSLCDKEEVPVDINYEDYFSCKRFVLPDHKYDNPLTLDQLNIALKILEEIIQSGPVYIHCVAGLERSPIVCMAWLVKKHNLTPTQALDYLMDIHIGTNPLPNQLKLLPLVKKK